MMKIELLKAMIAKYQADRSSISDYGRGLDDGVLIGLKTAVDIFESSVLA